MLEFQRPAVKRGVDVPVEQDSICGRLQHGRRQARFKGSRRLLRGTSLTFDRTAVEGEPLDHRIGSFTFFGPSVQIYTATHPMNAADRRTQEFGKPITIGADVWVGGAAVKGW